MKLKSLHHFIQSERETALRAGELLLAAAFVFKIAFFGDAVVGNADDFNHCYAVDISTGWWLQNRIQWIFTVPLICWFQRLVFFVNPPYVYVLTGFSGPLTLYFLVRALISRPLALIYATIYLSTQVIILGWHIPIGYNGIAAFFGLSLLGAYIAARGMFTRKLALSKTMLAAGVTLGITGAAVYEYYAFVFSFSGWLFTYYMSCRLDTNWLPKNARYRLIRILVLASPFISTLALKLTGILVAGSRAGFNSYSGTSFISDLNADTVNDSIFVGVQWILGATIGQNMLDKANLWANVEIMPSVLFGSCVGLSFAITLISLRTPSNWRRVNFFTDRDLRTCFVYCLLIISSTMSVFAARKSSHEILSWAGLNRGYSQQNADIVLPFFCLAVACVLLWAYAEVSRRGLSFRICSTIFTTLASVQLGVNSFNASAADQVTAAQLTNQRRSILFLAKACSSNIYPPESKIMKRKVVAYPPYFIERKDWPHKVCRDIWLSPHRMSVSALFNRRK